MIDFYFDEAKASSMDAFTVDVRPALDGVTGALDRTKMGVRALVRAHSTRRAPACRSCAAHARPAAAQIYVWCSALGLPCPVTGMPSSVLSSGSAAAAAAAASAPAAASGR